MRPAHSGSLGGPGGQPLKSPRRGRRKRSVPIKRSPALLLPGQREPWRRLWLGSDCGRSSWFEFSSARLRRTWRRQGTGSGEVGGACAPGACARTHDPPPPPEFQGAPERLSLPRAARPFVPAPGSRVPRRAHAALPPQDLSPGGEQRKSPCHEPQLFGDRRREARRLRALRGRGVRWVWLGRGRVGGRRRGAALALRTRGSLTHRLASSPGDGYRLIMRGAHLTAQEMFTALASHIRVRNAAAAAAASASSADKPGPVTGTRR